MLIGTLLLVFASPADDGTALTAFARCAIDADRAGASAMIAAKPNSREASAGYRKMVDKRGTCGAGLGKTRVNEETVRGAVARQLYLDAYAAPPTAPVGAPPPFQGSGEPTLVQYDLTSCAVTRDPVAADALVRAAPESAEEKAAFPGVIAALGRCTPSGAKIGFTRAQVRAGVAEGALKFRGASIAQ